MSRSLQPVALPMAAKWRPALALGACGVQVGTCLLVSQECPIHENYKMALLKAKDSDTTVTGAPSAVRCRVLKNKMAREYLALESRGATLEELERCTLGGLRRAVFDGDVVTGSVMTGQVAGMLHEIRPLREIFQELYTQGLAVLGATGMHGRSRHEAGFFVRWPGQPAPGNGSGSV